MTPLTADTCDFCGGDLTFSLSRVESAVTRMRFCNTQCATQWREEINALAD